MTETFGELTGFCDNQAWCGRRLEFRNRQEYFLLFFDMAFIIIASNPITLLSSFSISIAENHYASIT